MKIQKNKQNFNMSCDLAVILQEIKLLFPNSQRMNRGTYESKQLIEACRSNNVTDFIVLHETRFVIMLNFCDALYSLHFCFSYIL